MTHMITRNKKRMSSQNGSGLFVYRPEISLGDTNVVGNVYFANFVRWQGACREKFLSDYCPKTLNLVTTRKLILHTTSVTCEFKDPIGVTVGDAVRIEMQLTHLRGGRLTMFFEYIAENDRRLIALGTQKICCKKLVNDSLVGAVFPVELLLALKSFSSALEIHDNIQSAIEFQSDLSI